MQQKTATLDDAIAALEHFRTRVAMYIYPVDIANVRSFLSGVETCLRVFGLPCAADVGLEVQKDRGWKQSPVGPVPQMEEKGMTPAQIIDELIDMEIETLRRRWDADR